MGVIKKLYKNSDIKKYFTVSNSNYYIFYIDKDIANDDFINKCPNIYNYLLNYKEVIQGVRKSNNETSLWFKLDRSRDKNIFISPKIVAAQRSKSNTVGYTV